MSPKARLLLVIALLVLVPLRALAATTGGLCAAYAADEAAAGHAAHHHGAAGDDTPQQTDGRNAAPSICSLCTACCTGVTFVAEAPSVLVFNAAYGERIPFLERRTVPPHPDALDRPPLSR